MPPVPESFAEYAVEVVGLGFHGAISEIGPEDLLRRGPLGGCFDKIEEANWSAESLRAQYRKLGLPKVADAVRVVCRTVTLTCSEWTPAPADELVAH